MEFFAACCFIIKINLIVQGLAMFITNIVNTSISQAEEQDISHVQPTQNQANWVCCPEIMNVYPSVYPVCNNRDCRKKISENPGSKIVRCLNCNRAMLLKNCYIEMNINFHLEKQDQHYSVTAFPKIAGKFLGEDILATRTQLMN